MNYRVVAFDPPFSDRRMILTRPLQVSGVFSLNDLSSLELTYPEGQANYDVINPDKDYPAELCLEYFNPETDMWEEPLDARYIMLKASGDNSEEHPVRKFSALSIKWLLRKTKVWSAGGDEGEERIFRDVSIGSLLKTILNEAYARGIKIAHPDNIGFTDTLDSAGSSWGGTVSMSFPINMSLEEVFNNLVEQGYIDWAMSGRRILVWKADSTSGLARDRRNITLDNVFGTTSSPEDVSYDSLMTDARVLGETQSWSFSNNLSTPWGRLEDIISQAGVDDPITAEEATQKILLEGERPSRTHTKELAGSSMVQPFKDIRPGDWVNAQVHRDRSSTSSYEEMRIQEISLDISGRHFTWNVTMGDRTSDILEKIARKQSALSGGSSGGTSRTPSGSPGGSSSQVGDWRVPTTPLNFSVKVSSHLDADTNRYKGRAVFNWFDDGMGIDPEDQTLSPQARRGYEVQYRVVGTTDYTTLAWYGPDASSSPQIYYPLDVINPQTKNPYSYEFRLRTLGAEEHSAYTNAVVVMMLADTTPPSKPSKPTTQAYLGTISVTTDLKTSTGGEFELDFSHLIVESRHYADSEVVRAVGEIYGNALILPGLTENTNYEFRFIAVDTAGNRSTPSDWSAPVAVQPLVDSASIQSALEQSQMLLDESVRETQARFSELNTYLDSAFADIETDIGEAVFAASSPNIFSQDTPPVDPKEGYLWFDTDNNNLASVWDGSRWVPLRDGAIEDLQSALSTKSTTHFSSTSPTTPDYGDLWFNPSKNNEVRRWDGNEWAIVTDPKIQEALTTAQRAEEAADGKIQTFLGPEPPTGTGYGEGDLWFDSNDGNRLYRWNETTKEWEDARDRSIGEFHAWQSDLISALEGGEYGRVSTYYQDTAPTGPMPGDLWVDTSSGGTLKIWNSSTSKWDAVTDPSLKTALENVGKDVEAIQDSVIHTYVQPSAPTQNLSVGDLWFDSDDNNKLWRYSGTAWVVVQDKTITALQSAVATKVTTFYGSTTPTGASNGDLWFNSAAGNEVKRFSNGSWDVVTDPRIATALSTANTAKATADGKIQSFYQPEEPTGDGLGLGDIWFDSNDGNKMYRYNPASNPKWVLAQDSVLAQLPGWQNALINDLNSGKYNRTSTYYQSTAPTNPQSGDMWLNSNDKILRTWNSSTSLWDIVRDPALVNAVTSLENDLGAVQDSVIHTYVQDNPPVGSTEAPLSVGDLWFDSNDNNKLWRYSGTAWVVVQDKTISALQSAVATKITTHYGSTTPASPSVGDLWFNSSSGNEVKRWSGAGGWVLVTDSKIQTALSAANDAKATADGKIQTFLQTSPPTGAGLGLGDIWFDSDDGNKMYRYDPAANPKWVPAQDKVLSDLPAWQNSLINDLKAGTYSRVSTYYQNTAPTSPRTGDLWVDTANNSALKTWNGASWVAVTDPVLMSTVADLGNDVEAIKDGVIETFIQPTAPVSTTQNKLAEGDLWFDSDDNNKMYRYNGTKWVVIQDKNIDLLRAAVNTKVTTFYGSTTPTGAANGDLWFNSAAGNEVKRYSNGSWILVTDTKIQAALNTANDAKATADGKIQTFFQPTAPTSADLGVGDLWFDSDDGNKMYRYNPSANPKWVLAQDKFISNFSAWESAFINSIKAGDYARVSTFYQTTAPTKPLEGDLWMDTNTGVLKRWNSSTKTWDLIQDSDLKASIVDLGTDLEAIQDSVIHTYVQSTSPTGTLDRPLSVGDLWFDSANGNKLHRYGGPTPGWVPVSDTSITDAVARSIPIIIHSTSAASSSSTAASGSTWFQHLPTINGPVVAQWTKDGSTWVPVTVSSEVIANLDVGKLTAGTANLSTAVVNKLFANIFAAKKITATELSVAPDSLFPDPLFEASAGYAPWSVVSGGLELTGNGKQIGSYFNSLTISVTPGEEYMFSMDKTTLPTVGLPSDVTMYARSYDADGNMISLGILLLRHNTTDKTVTSTWTAPDNVSYIMVGFFSNSLTATGTQVRISNILAHKRVGGVLIKDGAVIAEHITASSSLTAKVAQFLKVTANMIEANSITSSHLEAGSVKAQHMNFEGPISAGGGYQLTIDSTGIRFYYVTDADNNGVIDTAAGDTRYLVTSLTGSAGGENGALYSIVDKDTGNTLASMTEGGDINAIQGNFENDISLSGRTMLGSDGILDDLPKGVVSGSVGYRFLKGTVAAGDWGFLETSFLADPNRVYKLITEGFSLRNTENDAVVLRIRYTTDGSTPSFSSPLLGANWVDDYYVSTESTTIFIPGQTWLIRTPSNIPASHIVDGMVQYRLLFQLYTYRGGLHFYDDIDTVYSRFKTWVEDMGRDDPGLVSFTNRDLFYPSRYPGTGSQPVETNPVPPKVLKSKTYYVSTHKNYYANWPGPTSGGEYVWSTYTTKNLFLGSYSGAKDIWSFGLLPNMTTELSGADIKSATITFKVNHTYSTTGSNVAVWMNGNSSLGSTMPSSLGTMVKNVLGAKRGSTYSVAVPSSMYAGLKSGQFRAISFGFNSNVSDSVYAYVDKASIRLKIDYYK